VEIKRIFAGSLAALLLCVSSLAAACDLSCGFALFQSDCHSQQMAAEESRPAEMTMAGMTMPEMAEAGSADQQMTSSAPLAMRVHAVLVDMGACERQPCDQAQALASKINYPAAAQFETISTFAGFSHMDSFRAAFHEARDDIAPLSPVVHTPLDVSLRI
jgi:hypothetical protein